MITGHFGLVVGVKKFAPRLPLWSLLLATFWLDIIFMVLSIAGLESFTPMDSARPAYGEVIVDAQYTHSLIGAILISILTGWLAGLHWEKKGGMVIGLVVFSHWILDLLVHRPDLPILPGNFGDLPLLGLGLWEYPRASAGLELILVVIGASLYLYSTLRSAQAAQRRRAWIAGITTIAFLLLLYVVNTLRR